jgi:hypothetical protein
MSETLKKYTYIVPFYFGRRMNLEYNKAINKNKFFFAEKHFEFLQNYKENNLEKIIFVINMTVNDNLDEIQDFFAKKSENISDNVEVNLLFRDNVHFSYGAWNHAIIDDLNSQNSSEYYFCFEEDYIANSNIFILPFIKKCNQSTPYICSKAVTNHSNYIDHPSISVGIFLKDACRKVYESTGDVFLLEGDNSYYSAWNIQQTFYKPFIDMGYKIDDILDEHSFPFLCSDTNEITYFGDQNKSSIIEPILV